MRWTAIAIGALALTACSNDGPLKSADQQNIVATVVDEQPTTIPTPIDREAALASAIDVRADGCGPRVRFGTGTVIPDNLILTAAHVVSGAKEIEVIDTTGVSSEATVVLFDPDLDVAVLRPTKPVGTPIQLRTETAREDETGIVVLSRLIDGAAMTEVIDVRVLRSVNILTTDIYLEQDVEREGFEVAAAIDPGDSGAMVHLPGGGVGIIWARSTANADRAWAVDTPTELLDPEVRKALLAPVGVGPCTGQSGG